LSGRYIAGLDPGDRTGLALLELPAGNGERPRLVETRTLRLMNLHTDLRAWMLDHITAAFMKHERDDPTPAEAWPDLFVVEGTGYTARVAGQQQAASSAGYNLGYTVAVLNALECRHEVLTPNEWRRKLGLNGTVKKQHAWAWCAKLVDDFDLATNEHQRDAVCIALAGAGFVIDGPA